VGLTDGTYTITLEVTDNAGNREGPAITRFMVVDNTPPLLTFNSFVATAGTQYQVGAGSTMYYNNTQTGSVMVKINATDLGAGVSQVAFPTLTAGWAPVGGADTTGPSPYDFTYSWGVGAAAPNLQNVTGTDNAGQSSTLGFTILNDIVAPSGGTLTVTNGITSGVNTSVSFATGADAASGIGTFKLQRAAASYAGGVCGAFSPFTDIGPGSPVSPYVDATIADGACYEYQLIVNDKVSNTMTVPSASIVMVDQTRPTGSINAAPLGPIGGTINSITGTSADTMSGVQKVDVKYSGPQVGNICLTPGTPTSWDL